LKVNRKSGGAMNRSVKSNVILILIGFLIILNIGLVVGASNNILDNALSSFKGLNIGAYFLNPTYYPFLDAVIYFILFIGLAKTALGEKFKDNKTVPVMMGVILAIAMAVFEYQSGFKLADLAPFAAFIVFLMFGIGVYSFTKARSNSTMGAIAVGFLAMDILITQAAPKLNEWIDKVPWLATLKSVILVASIIALIYSISDWIKARKSGKGDLDDARREELKDEKRQRKLLNKENKAASKIMDVDQKLNQLDNKLSELEKIEEDLDKKDILSREEQLNLIRQLESTVNGTIQFQKSVQNIYSNINRPEYQQYRDNLQTYSENLQKYITSLKSIIIRLKSSVENCKNDIDKKLLSIDEEFDKDIAKICEDNIDERKDIDTALKELKGTAIYPSLLEKYILINQKTVMTLQNDGVIADRRKTIVTQTKYMKEADDQILINIDQVLNTLDKDPLHTLNILDKTSRAITFRTLNPLTLNETKNNLGKIRSKIEEILAHERSNTDMSRQINELVRQFLTAENDLVKRYPEFIEEIKSKIIELYKSDDKLFEDMSNALITVAKKMIVTDPNIDPGLINLSDIQLKLTQWYAAATNKQTKIKSPVLSRKLTRYLAFLRKCITNYTTKDKTKILVINKQTQKLLREFIDDTIEEIQERQKVIIENAKK